MIVLIAACVNVANLFMVRAAGRRHESSVRMALGAGRLTLMRQLMTESLVIAAAGCISGIALGRLLMAGLTAIAPPGIPRIESAGLDWRVFTVSAALAIITGLIFGMAPAWQASRMKPVEALKTAARGAGGAAQVRWRTTLTIAEVALALVLLVGAGLLLRSFGALMGVDLGFQPDHVIAMNLSLPQLRYPTADKRLEFFQQLEARVRALPGVRSVAYANRMPLRGRMELGHFPRWQSGSCRPAGFSSDQSRLFRYARNPITARTLARPRGHRFEHPGGGSQPGFREATLLDGGDPIGHTMQRSAENCPKSPLSV